MWFAAPPPHPDGQRPLASVHHHPPLSRHASGPDPSTERRATDAHDSMAPGPGWPRKMFSGLTSPCTYLKEKYSSSMRKEIKCLNFRMLHAFQDRKWTTSMQDHFRRHAESFHTNSKTGKQQDNVHVA
jgi:hypothetical protein